MKKVILLTATLLVAVIWALGAQAQELKIGVINVQQILQKAPQMAKISADLKKQFGDREQQVISMQKQFQRDADNFKKNSAVMKDVQRRTAEQNLLTEQQNLQQAQANFQRDYLAVQNKKLQDLLDQVKVIVNRIAANEKYSMILTNSSVAYSDANMDLTNQVIEQLK